MSQRARMNSWATSLPGLTNIELTVRLMHFYDDKSM